MPVFGLAVLALAASASLTGSVLLLRSAAAVDSTTAAIRAAVQGAIVALYYDDFPPDDYVGGPLSSAAAATIRDRVVTDIRRYFSPEAQARYEPLLLNVVDGIGTSDWDAAGGVSAIDWQPVTADANHATAHLRTTDWVVRRGGQSGTSPSSTYHIDSTYDWGFSLISIDDRWVVDDLSFTCVAGCP